MQGSFVADAAHELRSPLLSGIREAELDELFESLRHAPAAARQVKRLPGSTWLVALRSGKSLEGVVLEPR
jgi:signal transduction histidine kinase